jgi:hypothetical protein
MSRGKMEVISVIFSRVGLSAYPIIFNPRLSGISYVDAVGLRLQRGSYRAQGSGEEKDGCRNLHTEGLKMIVLMRKKLIVAKKVEGLRK